MKIYLLMLLISGLLIAIRMSQLPDDQQQGVENA